ncbi:hypothetical protein CAL65_20005 [Alkalilimnicola ehrlichii]|uniref:IPT/TIG domain-containing protein n=1 Tax=Alkalilimnicola ehrlichii TaxID=351052 RepID=A0A3E0WJN4_9GAMM|nr:hypothetical protein CAL65_20005 [Alkalilimnicola ehrlichii]
MALALVALLLWGASAQAAAGVDIRAAVSLGQFPDSAHYTARVADCSRLRRLEVEPSGESFAAAELSRISGFPLACSVDFVLTGAARFSPRLILHFTDGSRAEHAESFAIERNPPSLQLQGVAVEQFDGEQHLVVQATAADDVDLSYVGFSVIGVRASELRSVGGVISELVSANRVFAATEGVRRVYPTRDGQTRFALSVPMTAALDGAAIAHDGVVLVDLEAVDASGNRTSRSQISFTGSDVVEEASALTASPSRIVFNNMLQSATVIPSVQFQFRGLTPLPGPGTGVTYTSSHPSLVAVTPAGTVYPLRETNGEPVTVRVSYQGLPDVEIPVEVDLTKQLVGLVLEGLDDATFELPRLNGAVALPPVLGVFDDGSRAEVGSQLALSYRLPESAAGVLSIDAQGRLTAQAVVPASVPIPLTVALRDDPAVSVNVAITAVDALPEVALEAPRTATVGEVIRLRADARDDVGIEQVRFLMNGAVVGTRQAAPYELTIDIPEQLANHELSFEALAIDTAGQTQLSEARLTRVRSQRDLEAPEVDWELPEHLERRVEGTPLRLQLARRLADVSEFNNDVDYIDFYLGGERVGDAHFPVLDKRSRPSPDGGEEDVFYMVWRLDTALGRTSTRETSVAVHAVVHGRNGASEQLDSRLIRVLQNQPPSAVITSPVAGESITAGRALAIAVDLMDDTLFIGADVELLVNGQVVEQRRYDDPERRFQQSVALQQATQRFRYDITEEMLGDSLELQVRVVDFHGQVGHSEPVRVSVREDQPPTVALVSPTEGAHIVAGQPVELQALASDDTGVQRVDFYADGRLVGSDAAAPFSYVMATEAGVSREQVMTLQAVALDLRGQEGRSEPVQVVLGRDEERPVVNLVSPAVTGTEGGDSIAQVVEDSEIVLKVAGYDNVKVEKLTLRGVRQAGSRYELTGNPDDVLEAPDFAPQQVPGAMNAFSALKIVRTPLFSGADVEWDRYPVSVTATDAAGNSSTAEVVIVVAADQPPEMIAVEQSRPAFFPRGRIELNAHARDDKAVQAMEVRYYLNGAATPLFTERKDDSDGYPPAREFLPRFVLDLAAYDLPNEAHTLRAEFVAIDDKGQRSDGNGPFVLELPIRPDTQPPRIAISEPVQNARIYRDNRTTIRWRATDNAELAAVSFHVDGTQIHQEAVSGDAAEGSFSYTPPDRDGELVIVAAAEDIYGNRDESNWRFQLDQDQPPTVSIRSPAQGSRLVEGEPFTMTATASDDREVVAVNFFIERVHTPASGEPTVTRLVERSFSGEEVAAALNAGRYLSAGLRTPHRPDDEAYRIRIGAEAFDNADQRGEALLDVTILNDEEPPNLVMAEPDGPFTLMPGDSFTVSGSGDDNYYVDDIQAVLTDADGHEEILEWEVLSRNDRVERVTIPNPETFGELIVGERFFTDFKGRIQLPRRYLDHAGEQYRFSLRSRDYGHNEVTTAAVQLTVAADEEPPEINLSAPSEQLYDRQPAYIQASISDNVAVAEYSVWLDDADEPLAAESGLNAAMVETPVIELDLSEYAPLPAEGRELELVIRASDQAGNEAELRRRLQLLPDQPPELNLIDRAPNANPVRGGVSFYALRMRDDYASVQDPIRYFPLFSSLSGLLPDGHRQPKGGRQVLHGEATPVISLNYPEAGTSTTTLSFNGETYLQSGAGVLQVYPAPNLEHPRGELRLALSGAANVRYRVRTLHDDPCSAEVREQTFEAADGVALDAILTTDVTAATIVPEPLDAAGAPVATFIREIRIERRTLAQLHRFQGSAGQHAILVRPVITVVLDDARDGEIQPAFLSAGAQALTTNADHSRGYALPVPADYWAQAYTVLAHAIDRHSGERDALNLFALLSRHTQADERPPQLSVVQPRNGQAVVAGQHLQLEVAANDAEGAIDTLRVMENRGTVVRQLGGRFAADRFSVPYTVPFDQAAGTLELLLVAEDRSGHASDYLLTLPVAVNEPPQLAIQEFASHRVGREYRKVFTQAERLNAGEFWVRSGEQFHIRAQLSDDSQLRSYVINRLDRAGNRIEEYRRDWGRSCPEQPTTRAEVSADIAFAQSEPTEYELVVEDEHGQTATRSFIVHPEANMNPAVRIVSPAQDQYIVAGTFAIRVGVVATDDREFDWNKVEVYANGERLSRAESRTAILRAEEVGGEGVIEQAFASIYDEIESRYSIALANEHGRRNSPNADMRTLIMAVPSGMVRYNEELTLTAVMRDSDGAVGRHEISINVAADEIRPEVIITRPEPGYGPTEASDFTLGFRAYDNVKVERLELYTAYGVRSADGSYRMTDYGSPLAVIDDIEARDFLPVTTVNIDTPEYTRIINVGRRQEILDRFPDLAPTGEELLDVWVQVIARDAAGNERAREVSYPVRADEPPVVDIVKPAPGERVVEGTRLAVNVNAFDDVGIDYVRLVARHGSAGTVIHEQRLRQAPYTFQVTLPDYDPEVSANNRVTLSVEALDTYGARFGDLNNHLVEETITIELVEDEPPTVAIGHPDDGAEVIEGQHLLVQVNAVDDVGIERVSLQVAGLIGGDRTYTDTSFPYEFLVEIPYGQAGRDLELTATATEIRLAGEPRVAETPAPVRVRVEEDVDPPEIIIRRPAASGASVVEQRSLPVEAEVHDNVRVSTVTFELLADTAGSGNFDEADVIARRLLLAAPYAAELKLASLADYLGEAAEGVEQLNLQLRVHAMDGAGNESQEQVPVTLMRNQPPTVTGIDILDSRGFSLGRELAEITENRGIVVHVTAQDPEAGVDSVRLFRAITAPGAEPSYERIGESVSAPFQFHLSVPTGRVGDTLSFKAEATDVDGYVSEMSAPRDLLIVADEPPSARIVRPANNESAVIEGQDVEVWVEAIDDLGPEGIDRVVFYVNGNAVHTAYSSATDTTGSFAQEHIYRALITPPEGVKGLVIHAVAYDVLGQRGETEPVRVGVVDDTVAPRLEVIQPFQGEILTAGEPVRSVALVSDIGVESQRRVTQQWLRERQRVDGTWEVVVERQRQLFRNDADTDGAQSDPDRHYYVYRDEFVDGALLARDTAHNERVRVVTTVRTDNHSTESETRHEIGLRISERRFLLPGQNARTEARNVYYTAVDHYRGEYRHGALLGAWATQDPMRIEQGTVSAPGLSDDIAYPRTGLFIADAVDESHADNGEVFIYSDLMAGAAEIFAGTIGEIHADADFVLAAKSGVTVAGSEGHGFVNRMRSRIDIDPETGGEYLDNTAGELLIFTVNNADGQFGLPYLLAGRVDMPYPDLYGVTRRDNLALVANGHGGVQVVDISDLSAPYHVGYIKPNGFSRDVAVHGNFAFIAASHEGLVVADLADPSMPIVARLDTFGVANRLHIEGETLYLTDMAGDGNVSALNIIDIRDPYQPRLRRVVDLQPAQADLVPDGSYDVTVAGGFAYVSVHYSDQEDKPAQALVEIVDLRKLDDPRKDATVPVLTHPQASAEDFAARGMVLARGGVQVAAGKRGINRIELAGLTLLSHQPARDARDVATDLARIRLEFSAVLPAGAPLAEHIRVLEGDPLIGRDVSEQFSLSFGERNGEPHYRMVELRRNDDALLLDNTEYHVVVSAGLAPLAGRALAEGYSFAFTTSPAGVAAAPDIASITPPVGGIDGGTKIVVRGHDFGDNPELYLGGQRLLVDRVEPPRDDDPFDKIYARTIPNYPGPAAVTVVNDDGLRDTVLGAFTYVNLLHISFVDPPVVRVSQTGEGDRVSIVGYGFHPGVTLTAYQSGNPDTAVTDTVDQNRLRLYSAERMSWTVPNFDGSYRGFVDIEIRDADGRRHWLPNALFYGRLHVDRRIEVERPFSRNELDQLLAERNPHVFIPDPMKLPPGAPMALATDAELGLVYVLGRGVLAQGVSPETVSELDDFYNLFAPGWISLVHYQPDALGNAAPMHGLGYFNLPQELVPRALHLADEQLYVAAEGYELPYINTPYEAQRLILVYDREDRLPGSGDAEAAEGKDRDILYALSLNFEQAPRHLASADALLFAASPSDGVAVISLADPRRPTVVRVIHDVIADGRRIALRPSGLAVNNGRLYVSAGEHTFVFDASRPTLPQLGVVPRQAGQTSRLVAVPGQPRLARPGSRDPSLFLFNTERPDHVRLLGRHDNRGFDVPGSVTGFAAAPATTATGRTRCGGDGRMYLALHDISRADQLGLLDALPVGSCGDRDGRRFGELDFTADGVLTGLITAYGDAQDRTMELLLLDTLMLDLDHSLPADGEQGFGTDQPLVLYFNRPLDLPAGEDAHTYLARYLALLYDDGDSGLALPFSAGIDADNPRRVVITPQASLQANAAHRLELKGVLGSRRTAGLFDYTIRFQTAAGPGARPQIARVETGVVPTTGGEATVVVRNANGAVFLVAGENAPIQSSESLGADETRFTLAVPPGLAGPAELAVINGNGGRDRRLGAINYVEPLELVSIAPAQGTVNGGTEVTLKGRGFQSAQVEVRFDDIPADADQVRVLDSETIRLVTPAGRIGTVDVEVRLENGQFAVLPGAFEYQQPVQSNIEAAGDRIYDLALDPTGTYLVAAAGTSGVRIYNIDASTYTTDAENPLNLDDLRRRIDFNRDGKDDRILAEVRLPQGYAALGVATYFERSTDRVFVTGARLSNGQPVAGSARLFVIAFDSRDLNNTSIVNQLPLPADFARGLEVENGHAVIAMAQGGIGIADVFLQTKSYLNSQRVLPNEHAALDLQRLPMAAGENSFYAVVAGEFNVGANRLENALDRDTGGFYMLEGSPEHGLQVVAELPVPASRVAVAGDYAYLAAGDAGMVVVDIGDPRAPAIVSRVNELGFVHDVSVSGSVAYLALGERGVATVDVTNPAAPLVTEGMEAFPGNRLEVVLASDYAAISAGRRGSGNVVQVTPDVVLKVHGIHPANGILDRDANNELVVWLRFNKAIDNWPDNRHRFRLLGPAGEPLPVEVAISNNDARLTLVDAGALQAGDRLTAVAEAGVESVNLLDNGAVTPMYRLRQSQQFPLLYRGRRPDSLRLEAVVPRRIPLAAAHEITVSGIGIPTDAERVRVYVGAQAARIVDIESNDERERAAIIRAEVPAIASAGIYDVAVAVERFGAWEEAFLRGALAVDAPLQFDAISPQWGSGAGGDTVIITGQGFEPGNTVMDGLKIKIGSVPVRSIRVLSSEQIEVVTGGGTPGLHNVYGEDRYGTRTVLSGEQGFGYGLRRLASHPARDLYPTDIVIDQATGVAITNSGLFTRHYGGIAVAGDGNLSGPVFQAHGLLFSDPVLLSSFDIQNARQPLLVGGVGALPSGPSGRNDLAAYAEYLRLSGKAFNAEFGEAALSDEERQRYEELQAQQPYLPIGADSLRIHSVIEREEGVERKRLYLAAGTAGAVRFNLDEQNGLQLLSQTLHDGGNMTVTDVLKWGNSLFALQAELGTLEGDGPQEPCDFGQTRNNARGWLQR